MKHQDTIREALDAREDAGSETYWSAVCEAYEARISQLVAERDAAVDAADASLQLVAELGCVKRRIGSPSNSRSHGGPHRRARGRTGGLAQQLQHVLFAPGDVIETTLSDDSRDASSVAS